MKPNHRSNPFLSVATLGLTSFSNLRLPLSLVFAMIPFGMPSAVAATRTWDGGALGTGTSMDTAANWTTDTLPTTDADIAQWNGTVAGDLSLTYTLGTFGGAGGMSLDITSAQTGAVTINEASGTSGMRIRDITIASGAGAFSFGTTSSSFMTLGSGTVLAHTFTNNSSNAATLGNSMTFGFGGSGAHTLALAGTGNWNFGTKLGTGGGSLSVLSKTGLGNLTFTATTGGSGQSNIGTFNAGAGRTSIASSNAITAGFINIGSVASGAAAFYQSGTSTVTNTNTGGGGFQVGGAVGSYGYYKHSGGVINVGGEFDVGGSSGGLGTFGQYDMTGGTLNLPNITGSYFLVNRGAAGGTAVVNIGGTVQIAGGGTPANSAINGLAMGLANVGSLTSAITLSGSGQFLTPSLTVKLNDTNFGASSNSTNVSVMNMNGGTLQTLGFGTAVNSGGGNGGAVINLNGGTIKAGNAGNTSFLSGLGAVNVYSGNGTIDNNGQAITIGQNLLAASGTGVSSVAVGTAGTGYVSPPKVVFSGGALTGGLGSNVATGYATIDSSTGAVTGIVITSPGSYTDTTGLAVSLVGPTGGTTATLGTLTQNGGNTSGGITFQGSGTTTVSGASTYTGPTAVNGSGTLLVNGSLASGSAVTVASTASLGGGVGGTAGTIGGAVTSAGTIVPGGAGAVGTLAFGGGLTLSGGIISLNLSGTSNTAGGTTNDLINITGNLNAAGIVLISPTFTSTPLANTAYQFASYTGTLNGASNLAAANRAITIDTTTPNQVFLTYTGASTAALTWNSTSSGSWDVLTSQNWLNGASQDYYYQADSVTFNDASGVQTAITINNSVSPASTTVNSDTNNFTFSGTSGIAGAGTLGKSGASALTITNANTYSGGTTLGAGKLNLNNASAIGSGLLTITGGTIDNTAALAVTLSTNNAQAWNGDFAFGGTKALNLGTGAVTLGANRILTVNGTTEALTIGGIIGGSGFSLTKNGTGTLVLTGANTYSGGTTVNGGVLSTNGNLGAANSAVVVNGGTLAFTVAGTTTNSITGSGNITSTGVTVAGNMSAFAGTFTHNSTTSSTSFNAATATSKDAAYVLNSVQGSAQGFIAGFDTGSTSTPYTLELGSLSGISGSLFRGGNTAKGIATLQIGNLNTDTTFAGSFANGTNTTIALTKVGTGKLTLSGASTQTGLTTVSAGTLSISADNNLGATAAAVSLNGGTLKTTNTTSITNTHVFTIGASGGTINVDSTGTAGSGQYFFNTANTLLGSGTLTLTGNGALATTGAGNLRIAQTNTYSGNAILQSGGIFEYGVANAVGGGATFTLNNESELVVQGGSAVSLPNAVTIAGGTNSVLSFENGNSGVFSGPVTLNADVKIGLRDWYNYASARSGTISGVVSGTGGITVDPGSSTGGILTLSATNTYTGSTAVNGGTLRINGDQSAASGAVTVASVATLGGSGTVGGATTISGTHAVGSAAATVGTQTFSSTLNYDTGSIFEWNLSAASTSDPGVVADASTGTYDQVVAAGAVTGGAAVFKVVLSGNSFSDVFWDTNKSWTNIFAGAGAPAALSSIFSSFSATGGLDSAGFVTGEGQFTFNGSTSTLNWSAVPEPTSALAGLLLATGLLRRRRSA